jgi:hypothetical protein
MVILAQSASGRACLNSSGLDVESGSVATAGNLAILNTVDNAARVGAGRAKGFEFTGPWLGHQNCERRIDRELLSRANHHIGAWAKQDLARGFLGLLINSG